MSHPAREKFLPLLSPYVDGELSPSERQQVEQHLQHNAESAALVADLRAGSALVRVALDMEADDVDWKAFNADVLAKVAPGKLPLGARLKLLFEELLTYRRAPMLGYGLAAAAALLVVVPVALRSGGQIPDGYAGLRVEVQTVSVDEPSRLQPVISETEQGDAVIWFVRTPGDGGRKGKKGEEGEEDLTLDPPTTPKAGEL